jgi:hypothetical protein
MLRIFMPLRICLMEAVRPLISMVVKLLQMKVCGAPFANTLMEMVLLERLTAMITPRVAAGGTFFAAANEVVGSRRLITKRTQIANREIFEIIISQYQDCL